MKSVGAQVDICATNSGRGVQIGSRGTGCTGCSILLKVTAVGGNVRFHKRNE